MYNCYYIIIWTKTDGTYFKTMARKRFSNESKFFTSC